MGLQSSALLSATLIPLLSLLAHCTPVQEVLGASPGIPEYALKYAPYSHLWSGEEWWPSDVATHAQNVIPQVSFTAVASGVSLQDLSTFKDDVYLTSKDNVEERPAWLLSTDHAPTDTGYSSAPATIICVNKNDGIVDCFYFYFYSYNYGNSYVSSFNLVLGLQRSFADRLDVDGWGFNSATTLEIGSIPWYAYSVHHSEHLLIQHTGPIYS
jgi:hypothetical protein